MKFGRVVCEILKGTDKQTYGHANDNTLHATRGAKWQYVGRDAKRRAVRLQELRPSCRPGCGARSAGRRRAAGTERTGHQSAGHGLRRGATGRAGRHQPDGPLLSHR